MSPTAGVVGALLVGAFLLGSIPFGVVVARLRGIDLRAVGSGNIGATNAARALGRPLGVLVLLLDAGKAFAPVLWVDRLVGDSRALAGGDPRARLLVAGVGLAAFLGHLYSPWLKLRGGKGVATGFGVFLALAPLAAAAAAAAWLLVYLATRTSSLGSLVAASLLPLWLALTAKPREYIALGATFYILIVWRHRDNLRRLFRRQETKL